MESISGRFEYMRNNSIDVVPSNAQPGRPRGRRARLLVSQEERLLAARLLASGQLRLGHERRLRVILLTAQGLGAAAIAAEVGISRYHISRVRARFGRGGLAGLADRPRAGRRSSVAPDVAARILAAAASPPPHGAQRWTLSLLAARFGLGRSVVYRILRRRPGAASESL